MENNEHLELNMVMKLVMADFEDNALVLRVPDGFWDKYEVRSGTVTISSTTGIIVKKAGKQ